MVKNPPIIIVGAGMAGCFLALCLAKKGYTIQIHEKRNDLASLMKEEGRSFNLTLYYRGIEALKKLSLWDEVKKYAQIAEGNVAHFPNGKDRFDRFDNTNEVLYTIHRTSLNKALILAAKKHPNISFTFHSTSVTVDKHAKELVVKDTITGKLSSHPYLFLVGADGAHSTIRSALQQSGEAKHSLVFSDWGYKEVWISPEKAGEMNLRKKATHTWPRDNSLLLAFPNPDLSCTLMFNLPINGEESFASLTSRQKIHTYLQKYFPELNMIEQEIIDSFLTRPLGNFVTVKTSPWYYKDSIVLVGDAAHAVLPFYGQGMCAAFEDCLTLVSLLSKYPKKREEAFRKYQEIRKRNTDILAELSVANFIELRDRTRSEKFIVKDQVYTLLNLLFPKFWSPPLYVLVAHSSLSYEEAVRKFKRQEKKARLLGIDLGIAVLLPLMKTGRAIRAQLNSVETSLATIRGPKDSYPIR